jgi:hypothetical protein
MTEGGKARKGSGEKKLNNFFFGREKTNVCWQKKKSAERLQGASLPSRCDKKKNRDLPRRYKNRDRRIFSAAETRRSN